MILLIDNYDSFSYNLYQLIGSIDPNVEVVRNDQVTLDEIREMAPHRIILSPGPGKPDDAGICMDVVKTFGGKIPILGVCLGHQAICRAYGGIVTYAGQLVHGKQDQIQINGDSKIFRGLPRAIQGARYHSLAAEECSLPEELKVTAVTADGEIMALEHKTYAVYGLQFHPESIMTPDGRVILENFLGGQSND